MTQGALFRYVHPTGERLGEQRLVLHVLPTDARRSRVGHTTWYGDNVFELSPPHHQTPRLHYHYPLLQYLNPIRQIEIQKKERNICLEQLSSLHTLATRI
ncbi:hypothetical protein N9L68_02405 [bacterium]|nr:hypothetical protein [bacterium]